MAGRAPGMARPRLQVQRPEFCCLCRRRHKQHKIRNVIDKLPERLKSVTEKRMRQAYHAESALKAEAELTELARELGKTHPGAAASLREGMAETLTVLRLGVCPTLARTLRSTNTIESMIEICREHSKNVTRWRDHNGAALVRGRHDRSREAIPPRQRPSAPAPPSRRARRVLHRECHCRMPGSHCQGSLMINGAATRSSTKLGTTSVRLAG